MRLLRTLIIGISLLALLMAPLEVFARENATYDPIFFAKSDILGYSPVDVGCSSSDNKGGLSGSDTQEKIWNFLTEKGLSPEQTSGVMSNLNHESAFQTGDIREGVFGIASWAGSELTTLKQAAGTQSKDPSDLEFQLNYLYSSLNARSINRTEYSSASYKNEWDGLTKQKSVNDALVFFHNEFKPSYLLGFDEPTDSDEHKAALALTSKDYDSSTEAVIGERGGNATESGLDPNGQEGAQFFMKQYGEDSSNKACGTAGKAVHPIANGDRVWEGYGGPRTGSGAVKGGAYCNTKAQGRVKWHNGYDLNGAENVTPVLAAMDGTVTKINYANPALDTVTITHPDGFGILYMHMNTGHIDVKVGDSVVAGQKIGLVGSGNGAYGAHLHVEIAAAGNTNPQVAALAINHCDGAVSVDPNLFFRLFGVELCPANNCDNAVINASSDDGK